MWGRFVKLDGSFIEVVLTKGHEAESIRYLVEMVLMEGS
jgi:hypothetical protein